MTSHNLCQRIEPWDEHNQSLVRHVHPPDWTNPVPTARYHLVVIGAGTAGLVTAAGAAGLGAKVALVEKHLMGGDCLNTGCVPSKTLIRAARAAHEARQATRFGVKAVSVEVDFAAVMQRVRSVRAQMSPHDSAARFRQLGVDVFLGTARFTGADTVEVGDATLRFHRAVVATGARPAVPDIPGLCEAGFLTNETVFNLVQLPRRLAVIGGGPIGCELAQAFQRLGALVILFHHGNRLLEREDAEAAAFVQKALAADGVQIKCGTKINRVETKDGSAKTLHYTENGAPAETVTDEILVGAGRVPNVGELGLETAGIAFDSRDGVQVNDHLRTTNRRVYAAGDVCMKWKFTHAADFAARIVIQNALFAGRKRLSALTIPRCTYTDPEVAQVGIAADEIARAGSEFETYIQPFDRLDRAITDDEIRGFVKIHVHRRSGRMAGATIMAPHAGDMIGEIAVAMAAGMSLSKLATVIHPYPTLAEAIRKCGDECNRRRLTPTVKKILQRWLNWMR